MLGSLGNAAAAPIHALGNLTHALVSIGYASIGLRALSGAAQGVAQALGVGLNVQVENTRAQMMAFTKSVEATDAIMGFMREEADKTPFTFQEMAGSMATLIPAARQAGIPLKELTHTAEVLAASHPEQGLSGAAFALREAVSGDFTSIIERFDLPRQRINQLKDQGIPALQAVQTAMQEMGLDMELVTNLGTTLSGRWSTFTDTIDDLRRRISEPVFDALKDGLITLQGWFDKNKEAVQGFADLVAGGLRDAISRFQAFAGEVFAALGRGDIQGALDAILRSIVELGRSMFGAGFELVSNLAGGILSGIGAVMDAAASVASSIAAFFIGASPPPEGPLSQIQEGGQKLVDAYTEGMAQASLGPVEAIAEKVQGSLTNFKELTAIGKDIEAQLRLIEKAQTDINTRVSELRLKADDIKTVYDEQLDALNDQIEAMDTQNDLAEKQERIQNRIRDMDLARRLIAAEGDPVKRAALQEELERLRQQQQELDIQGQIEDIEKRIREGKASPAELERLRNRLKQLEIQRELNAMVDKTAVAEIRAQQSQNKLEDEQRRIEGDQLKLQQEQARLPIEQQIKAIKREKELALKPVEAELKLLQRQSQELSLQSQQWHNLQRDIKAAADAVKPAAGGGGGGGGGAKGAAAAGGKGFLDTILEGIDRRKEEISTKGQEVAQGLVMGIQTWIQEHGASILLATLGAVLGGAVFGPVGAIAGAVFGAKLGGALQDQIPAIVEKMQGIMQVAHDAVMTVIQVFQHDWKDGLDEAGNAINPFVTSVGNIAIWIRDMAIPAIRDLATWLSVNLPPMLTWFQTTGWPAMVTAGAEFINWLRSTAFPALGELKDWLGVHLPPVINWIKDTGWPGLVTAGEDLRKKVDDIRSFFADLFRELESKGVFTDLKAAWDDLKTAGGLLANLLRDDLNPKVIDAKTGTAGLKDEGNFAKDTIHNMVQPVKDLTSVAADLATAFKTVAGFINDTRGALTLLSDLGRIISGDLEALLRILRLIRDTAIGARRAVENVPDYSGANEPPRARGGPVLAGLRYLVGEHGPESFVPAMNGRILSRSESMAALASEQRSGPGDITWTGDIVINAAPGMNTRQLAEEVYAEFVRKMRRNATLSFT